MVGIVNYSSNSVQFITKQWIKKCRQAIISENLYKSILDDLPQNAEVFMQRKIIAL